LEEIEKIDLMSFEEKYLIDYSNIKDGIIKNQNNFLNENEYYNFLEKTELGMPLMVPLGLECFDYSKVNKIFEINIHDLATKIFLTQNINYIGVKLFLRFGNKFCTGAIPKKQYKKLIKNISNINSSLKEILQDLKNNKKVIGVFQTRNIPHLGHEKIIHKLMNKCDIVVINPVIGPKKKNDIKSLVLEKAYKFLIKKFYNKKLMYAPLCANMFYSGPREAVHHALIRKQIGFDTFIVGRDHAGADNEYKPNYASDVVKSLKEKLGISIINHNGSFWCENCKKITIKGECDNLLVCNKKNNFSEISGTNFREALSQKKIFKFARPELQRYLFEINEEIFYK